MGEVIGKKGAGSMKERSAILVQSEGRITPSKSITRRLLLRQGQQLWRLFLPRALVLSCRVSPF